MMELEFFTQRPDSHPTVYAYELLGVASHRGYIKVGYTERDVDTRIKEQLHTAAVPYRSLAYWSAMKNDPHKCDKCVYAYFWYGEIGEYGTRTVFRHASASVWDL